MKPLFQVLLVVLLAGSFISACGSGIQPTPTATLAPSSTPLPTATFTLTSTNTPEPTNTPTPTDTPAPTDTPLPTATPPASDTPTPPAAPTASGASACPVSLDPTYGYTQDNPIRVGGDFLSGPQRESAYLDTLRGPGGEKVTYERSGSEPFEDTILDVYEVNHTGLAEPVILYLDEYIFAELQAPVGFTCAAPFPITGP